MCVFDSDILCVCVCVILSYTCVCVSPVLGEVDNPVIKVLGWTVLSLWNLPQHFSLLWRPAGQNKSWSTVTTVQVHHGWMNHSDTLAPPRGRLLICVCIQCSTYRSDGALRTAIGVNECVFSYFGYTKLLQPSAHLSWWRSTGTECFFSLNNTNNYSTKYFHDWSTRI